ncbi:hypothetical protein NDU88_004591, partial [Pleurodeles waltl]
ILGHRYLNSASVYDSSLFTPIVPSTSSMASTPSLTKFRYSSLSDLSVITAVVCGVLSLSNHSFNCCAVKPCNKIFPCCTIGVCVVFVLITSGVSVPKPACLIVSKGTPIGLKSNRDLDLSTVCSPCKYP